MKLEIQTLELETKTRNSEETFSDKDQKGTARHTAA